MTPMLTDGARVAILAPAGIYSPERLASGYEQLRAYGLSPVEAPNLCAKDRYCAGTAVQRLADLDWALSDPTIDAVWAARGGFGCAHLLPDLGLERWIAKPIIGFSDLTALLNPLHQAGWLQRGGQLIHGPVVQTLAAGPAEGSAAPVLVDQESRNVLQSLLLGEARLFPGQWIAGPRPNGLTGPVVGGNLAVLASLCGTPWQLQARGAIVLLEDVSEAPYRIDRLITQLLQSGALDGALAVGIGELVGCDATDASGLSYGSLPVLVERLAATGLPVVAELPFGHGPRNFAWPLGAVARMTADGLAWV